MNDKTNLDDCRNFKVYDNDYSESISSAIKILLAEMAEINAENSFIFYDAITFYSGWYQLSNFSNASTTSLNLKDIDDFLDVVDEKSFLDCSFERTHIILVKSETIEFNEIICLGDVPLWIISVGLVRSVLGKVSPSFSSGTPLDPALKN
jgi:hypothetical protein